MTGRLIGVVFASLLLVACGGGGAGDGASSTSPSGSGAPPSNPPPPPTPNRAPIIIAPERTDRVVLNHPVSYDLLANGPIFQDPDGDPIAYSFGWDFRDAAAPGNWSGLQLSGSRVEGAATAAGMNFVTVEGRDGRGGVTLYRITFLAEPNGIPIVSSPNRDHIVGVDDALDVDVATGVFLDPDGDALTFNVRIASAPRGLRIDGHRVIGQIDSIGAVRVEVTAADSFGGIATDVLLLAAPAPTPGGPSLPATSYVYDDALLEWPEIFRRSRADAIPFWDTTPADNPTTNAGATLGRVLFYDKRLSITNTHSCGSCHEHARGFTVGTPFAAGVTGELSRRNPMALTNARYNIFNLYFGDIRVRGLEELALMPINDATELGSSLSLAIDKIVATDFYAPLFEAAFGTPEVNSTRIARALAQFLRSIVSYRSRFDEAYLSVYPISEADPRLVLNDQELAGAELFISGNCGHCHGNDVHTSFRPENNGLDARFTDAGAGNGEFRATSLRNVAVSGPYMHDGRFATLREVIDHYDSGVQESPQLPLLLRSSNGPRRLNMSEDQKLALEAFLRTMTDDALLQDPKFSDPFN